MGKGARFISYQIAFWAFSSDLRGLPRRRKEGEKTHSSTTVHNIAIPGKGQTTRTYNVNGELVQVSDSRDGNKNRFFANDAQGRALLVVQGYFDGKNGRMNVDQAFDNAVARTGNQVKAQHFFFANDQAIGSFGQLTDEDGAFEANFDINYTPISSSYPAAVPSQVVVQGGDTLRTLAARVYGDASLWYVIAEENGLSDPDSVLEAGTQLRVPSEVVSLANTAWSFKPFDVSRAIGDTTPTQPPINRQKKNFWKKVIGIILVAVAVVVSVIVQDYTGSLINGALGALSNFAAAAVGGAAGSIVQQGLAIATGLQDSFSWDAVASAGLTAGILKGTGLGSLWKDPSAGQLLLQGAINSSVSQGVSIALGLQDSFSWREVAIAAASTGAAAQAGKWGQSVSSRFTDNPDLINLGGYLASGVASALIRTAFGGRMDVTAVAADVFGNALGNSIVDGMQPTPRSSGIGLTDEQLADMNRQVEAGYLASQGQFDDQLQRDVRQQQFQMSLQSDIERSLNNNPDFVANLPMPRAEFVTPAPTISRQARLDRDLMEQAIAGGVRTSLFNSSIENAFDTQLLDKLTRASVVDLRPTRENAIALGHEQRVDYYPHITAKMRPWDPAADARAKLAGNAIGSMVMNPFAAAGYLAGQATGNEDFALASSVLFGAAGDLFLAGAGSRSISRSMFAEPVALRPKVPLGYDVSKWAEYGLPSDGNFVRTLTREQYLDFKAGREFSFGGRPAEGYPSGMGFIGSAEEVRGISTAAGYREALKLDYTPQYLLEFQLRSPARLQNVLSAPYAEFVPGGRSGAGFMEFNYPGITTNDIVNPRVRVLQ